MKTMKRVIPGGRRAARIFSGVFLTLTLLCSLSLPALAASTGSLDPERTGSVTVILQDAVYDTMAEDGELSVYRVADLAEDVSSWILADAFAGSGMKLDDLDSPLLASSLAEYAQENGIAAETAADVENGEVIFSDLSVGCYLIVQTVTSGGFYPMDPFLVTVPQEGGTGWIYDVDASPKTQMERIPESPTEPVNPSEPETPTEPGISETPGSSESYDEDEDTDGRAEQDDEEEEPAVVLPGIGSSGSSSPSGSSGTLPQTGQLNWPIPFLAIGGLLLIALGMSLQRKETAAA